MNSTVLSTLQTVTERIFVAIPQTTVAFSHPLMGSVWTTGVWGIGAVPTTAGRQCNNSTTGALPLPAATYEGTDFRLTKVRYSAPTLNGNVCFYDRLVDYAGYDATLTTSQSVSAQTLPRFTTGDGVLPFLEVYTTTTSSAATATITYTNQSGTASRTGTVSLSASWATAGRFYPIQLQSGDTGVRSVQAIQLSAASGAAGSWGITLGKPVCLTNTGAAATFGSSAVTRDFSGVFISQSFPSTSCITYFCNAAGSWSNTILSYCIV